MSNRVTLVDVYINTQAHSRRPTQEAIEILYALIKEREPHVNISHKTLPSLNQHKAFVSSEPYLEWFLLRADDLEHKPYVGSIYITRQMEVGLFILKAYQNKDYGSDALHTMKSRYSKARLLANIAPENVSSQAFFERHGFKKIQHTYELNRA